MQTASIVSTPNITGNIGSCTSQVVSVVSQRTSIWTQDIKNIVTNSCTGEVKEFGSWEYADTSIFAAIGSFLVLIIVFSAIVAGIAD